MTSKVWFQPRISPIMEGIVDLHNHIFGYLIFVFFLVLWIFLTTLFFWWWTPVFSFSRFREYILNSRQIVHNTILETIWTIIPSFILVSIGIPSFALLYAMDEVINPVFTIKVTGHQWYWSYEYKSYFDDFINNIYKEEEKKGNIIDGSFLVALKNSSEKKVSFDSYMKNEDELLEGEPRLLTTTEPLVLPINCQIRLLITSADVIHSFAVPSLGLKVDAIPGRLNQAIIFIKVPGIYRGQCSEICGVNHGFMPIEIRALEIHEFYLWYDSKKN
jgi:cytochrome c oxidase subunit 2